jgi:hypothetical protein
LGESLRMGGINIRLSQRSDSESPISLVTIADGSGWAPKTGREPLAHRRLRYPVVIGAVFLAGLAVLAAVTRDSRKSAQDFFDRAIAAVNRAQPQKDPMLSRWDRLLRQAWMAELWDDPREARMAYLRLRDLLERVSHASLAREAPRQTQELARFLQGFVTYRLGALPGGG